MSCKINTCLHVQGKSKQAMTLKKSGNVKSRRVPLQQFLACFIHYPEMQFLDNWAATHKNDVFSTFYFPLREIPQIMLIQFPAASALLTQPSLNNSQACT